MALTEYLVMTMCGFSGYAPRLLGLLSHWSTEYEDIKYHIPLLVWTQLNN